MAGVGQQAAQGFTPGADILLRDLRHRDHLLVEGGLVFHDGVDRQQVRYPHLGFGDAADIGGHHRHSAEHGLDDDARARFRPQARHQQHARPLQQQLDVVHRVEDADVGTGAERGAVLLVGAPGGHGGEGRIRESIRERQKNRNALDGARIGEGDEVVSGIAERRPLARLHQRDRNVHGVDSGVAADVIGHVLAHADHPIGGADAGRLGFAGERAIGAERHGQRSARQVHDFGFRAQRGFEQKLRGVVGGSQDHVRAELVHLRGETGAQHRIGHHPDLHAVALEGHHSAGSRPGFHAALRQLGEVTVVLRLAEDAGARHRAALVAAGGQRLDQQPVGFVAAAVGRIV